MGMTIDEALFILGFILIFVILPVFLAYIVIFKLL